MYSQHNLNHKGTRDIEWTASWYYIYWEYIYIWKMISLVEWLAFSGWHYLLLLSIGESLQILYILVFAKLFLKCYFWQNLGNELSLKLLLVHFDVLVKGYKHGIYLLCHLDGKSFFKNTDYFIYSDVLELLHSGSQKLTGKFLGILWDGILASNWLWSKIFYRGNWQMLLITTSHLENHLLNINQYTNGYYILSTLT